MIPRHLWLVSPDTPARAGFIEWLLERPLISLHVGPGAMAVAELMQVLDRRAVHDAIVEIDHDETAVTLLAHIGRDARGFAALSTRLVVLAPWTLAMRADIAAEAGFLIADLRFVFNVDQGANAVRATGIYSR